jgi:hypothetical protein
MNNLSTTSAATIEDIFGPIISSYSRAEAIEDGVLIDLTKFSFRPNLNVCQEVGIKFSIVMTSAVSTPSSIQALRGHMAATSRA